MMLLEALSPSQTQNMIQFPLFYIAFIYAGTVANLLMKYQRLTQGVGGVTAADFSIYSMEVSNTILHLSNTYLIQKCGSLPLT